MDGEIQCIILFGRTTVADHSISIKITLNNNIIIK